MKQIQVLAQNKSSRGPGKVYQNLTKGLTLLGHGVNQPIIGKPDIHICLQMMPDIDNLDPKKTLYGPNLVVLPTEAPSLFSDPAKHFLVPSKWVKDKYCQFDFVHPNNLHVWPVGIDTDKWTPSTQEPTQDCFIYFKNRSAEDLQVVKLLMKKFGLRYSVLEYGKYQEQDLKDACDKSKFAVLLTNTESQGIAYLEILSTNTPCYVFNKTTWSQGDVSCIATSVPYFDEAFCGDISPNHISPDHFTNFLNKVPEYVPRYWLSLDLKGAAQNLMDIAHANLM